ncbi:MAG: fatty acid desaturase CarF family protein [Pyrinomonadaceae bacterium]
MSAFMRDTASLTMDTKQKMLLGSSANAVQRPASASDRAAEKAALTAAGYSGVEEHSTPFHAFLEHSTTLLYPVMLVLSLYFSLSRLHELELLWLVALAIPLSLVLGDLVSGLVHWMADTYFSEDTPVIGQSLVKPFRLHHLYPRDICTHGLVTTVGNVCILAVPVLTVSIYLLWSWDDSSWLAFTILCVALMSLATVLTNQFHRWAHQEKPSRMVCWLQRTRLVLPPTHHQIHHTKPFNMHYCITNGWLNPILNKIGFFRGLEGGLRFVGIEVASAVERKAPGITTADEQLAQQSPPPPPVLPGER